ncbi:MULTISPECIES: Fe-S cluster assembly protein SufB [Prochlorococcus]|uniref:ABC-type transport system involved in Fe-S cluster assembly permease component n=1 Tax=Prochlorococcus marinus (strain SARG / CCMP1375 / SS120) TaxID=167539 RepID=Q7VEC7_PROMA|nr:MULTISPECIES: Fe-S cluster assembly protein SufB [Prochlorococcus]AAP99132.1 ABC-type transport system involved in Fe-S cluster assembly permease component [Prochlorococcus marinus subsp. marinus str. CCMP1375]KGG32859.1 Iron-sulfur cluster assembly protein SufB [Prochlorococcus marinus str. SS51]KGG35455.1 Iron-sulfur cluster assembly protein SufB [Prochlorococcus sp. SS52]
MTKNKTVSQVLEKSYEYGFLTDVESEKIPKGINESIIRLISEKKSEPDFLLEFRLKAFRKWEKMEEPKWADLNYPPINYQDLVYYSAPKDIEKKTSLDDVDPEILATFDKLGIPLNEQKRLTNVAVDAVFDSVSIATTFKEKLAEDGVIFCSISEAIQKYPELVDKYLGTIVPMSDNFFAALNSAIFSDGSFVYIPKGVNCPMELSSYFRINSGDTGQFERTLIIAEEKSSVSYLEGCTAPMFDTNTLHAAVVELIALDDASIKYSTVQNWYAGDKNGIGGIYNFVTKRGRCKGKRSKISWSQVETGSSITWKYPSCILEGDGAVGEFYSVALTNNKQIADTGTKMIHIGKNTKSTIISKGISAGKSKNSYRGLVHMGSKAFGAKNYSQCDSLLIGDQASANTYPYIHSKQMNSSIEHEASTSKISEDQLFYLKSRGINSEEAVSMMVSGFCQDVFNKLPMEFASEADSLLGLKLEGTIG